MRFIKIKPYMRNIRNTAIFLALAFAISLVLIARDKLFVTKGTLGGSVFALIGSWGFFNAIHLYLLVCVILGTLYFLVHRIYLFIRNFKEFKANCTSHGKEIHNYTITFLLTIAAGAFIELVCSLAVSGRNSLGTYFNPYRFLFLTCALATIVLFVLYFKKKIAAIEHLFLFVTLCIGIVFSLCMPYTTNVSWDDQIHYKNTVATSFLTVRDYNGADYDMFTFQREVTYNMGEISTQMDTVEAAVSEARPSYENCIPFYQAVAYLPAAAGIAVNRLLDLPYAFGFYSGRYLNLIFYAVTIFFAIRRLKWGKSILMVIALFPTNIFLATNYSYDYFVTAVSLLGFAYLIGEMQRPTEKLTLRNAFITVGSLLLGFGPKAIYFPMLLLCLFLPKEKFASGKNHRRFRILVLVALCASIASFVLPFLMTGAGGNDARGGSDVNSIEQIKYILFHPLEYTKTLLGFLFTDYLRPDNSTYYTNYMAYLGDGVHWLLSMILLTVASLLDRDTEDAGLFHGRFRIATCILAFITICLIATALYVSFTPVGADFISGCSPRYLAPLIFPVVWCLGCKKIKSVSSKRTLNLTIVGISMVILYHNIWILCVGKYI